MKKELKEDTIIALATANGVGAISIIRLSGPESLKASDHVFSGNQRAALSVCSEKCPENREHPLR